MKQPKQILSPGKRKKKRILRRVLIGLVILLVAIRLMLPYIVLRVVNKKLTEIDGYTGHVDDIDLHLIVGSYLIKDIELKKTGGKIPVPFFSADVIDLSVEWKALFKGGIVGEIEVEKPILNFVKGPTKETSQTSVDKDWTQVVDELMPLKINRFEINNGEVHYRDFHSSPKIDVLMSNIHVVAENLTNVEDKTEVLPSPVTASANVYDGSVSLNMKLDPLNKVPTFDINAEMKNLNLVKVNDFLKAYANFDVQKGSFSVYTEAAAKDGKIAGYAKPLLKDIDVVNWKTEDDPVGQKLYESLVGFVAWIFKNHPEDQVATQIDFTGNISGPEIDIWSIIGETLRNAFIQALYPSLENTITLKSVGEKNTDDKGGFLKNIFGKDDDKDKDKDKKKK